MRWRGTSEFPRFDMSQGNRLSLQQARGLARHIVCELKPYCRRIRVAGSIRRRKETIGDIELVVIPKCQPAAADPLVQDRIEQRRSGHIGQQRPAGPGQQGPGAEALLAAAPAQARHQVRA